MANELALCASIIEGLDNELALQDIPGPKATRDTPIDMKTTGQLIDELIIMNQRIWVLIDKVIAGVATPEEAQNVQKYNAKRNEYVRAIDAHLGGEDIGAKIYGG